MYTFGLPYNTLTIIIQIQEVLEAVARCAGAGLSAVAIGGNPLVDRHVYVYIYIYMYICVYTYEVALVLGGTTCLRLLV